MTPRPAIAPFVALLALAACDEAAELGVDMEVREGAERPDGSLERCVVLEPIDAPVTLDRVTFEAKADGPGVAPRMRRWLDVSVTRRAELCLDVCACDEGEVGHFVIVDDGDEARADVDWPEDYCCDVASRSDGGVPSDGGA
ncbi:MAG TPA: hypothetical protein RMH99_29825 [Sandaracinaceae bacterium LLY-WYZ-13_1]|nr:hypothetical protein [Sandaracinaceae bacterium LLY-WYZ-13_1]